jgi:DNA (cytosine-5)-methyltransferase 1
VATIKNKFSVVDLFCGAGGLSLGLSKAGFEIKHSVDNWKSAVETYRTNLGDHVDLGEICPGIKLPSADLFVGGPPCQGFSSAGLRRAGDRRNTLVTVFSELIAEHRPNAFIFENVEGFLTGEGGAFVFDLLDPLIEAGYWISLRKINAANFGVPQHRKRVVAVGVLGSSPGFPVPTHQAIGAPGSGLIAGELPHTPSVQESLLGLPNPSEKPSDAPVPGHFSAQLIGDDLRRVVALKQGQTMKDLPEELWHDTYKKRAFRRVQDGTPTERRGGAPAGIRRLVACHPSKTITGGARGEFIHPLENRYLSLRECARLQTFPDSYIFTGSQSDQAQQIGNAVPPRLGEVIGLHIKSHLSANKVNRRCGKGRLIEFVPTLSNGMSPALKTLWMGVRARYDLPDQVASEGQLGLWV